MKKIRIKFFLIAALSLFVVLFSIIAGFNISNRIKLENDAKTNCDFILNSINAPFSPDNPPGGDPEIIFRSRYFIATYHNGTLLSIDTSKVARITQDEAKQISQSVYSSGSGEGFYNIYFYKKNSDSTFEKLIFLDVNIELDANRTTLIASSVTASVGYVIVLVLIYFFSFLIIKPIEKTNEKQKRFITDASHELKTPLTIINSNLSLIEMDTGSTEYTVSIKKQVERLTSMTNELVQLVKLNESDMKINKINFDMETFVFEISDSYLLSLKDKNIDLSINIEKNIKIEADQMLLGKLFIAFLDNMHKYASPGSAFIKCRKVRNQCEIIFQNKIEANTNIDVDSLFDRFYKVDESRHAKSNSFGIGLSMAKAIVEAHKGKISASISEDNIIFKIIL